MIKVTAKKDLDEEIVIDKALIGSKVIAKNGEEVGRLKDIYINPNTFQIRAITVSKGPFKFDHLIENTYIDSFGPDGVILNIIPLENLVNKKVIDNRGNEIGKIKKIHRIEPTNTLESLEVSPGLNKASIIIKPKDIKSIGQAVILKKKELDVT